MKPRILVIDDEESIRFTLDAFLSDEGYEVTTASNYDEAITCINTSAFDLVFADILLADGKTGIDILKEIKQREEGLVSLHVFIEKCMVEHAEKLREVNEELVEEMNCRLRLENELKQTVEKHQKSMNGLAQTMALAIESNDNYAAGHQARVAQLARHVAREMRLSKDMIDKPGTAAAIHDIGKASVPARVFNKTDGQGYPVGIKNPGRV